ncbi:hypothetical protein EXIGLDRAFT_607554, partial [Exidia glandulosa HHB12029]
MILFARSQRQNVLQRKLSIYLKAKGTPTKVFDFLQSLGLTLSYDWTLSAIDSLADSAMADMQVWVATEACIIDMDNVLLVFGVQSQRAQNRAETINATAATVIKLPRHVLSVLNSNPSAIPRLSYTDLLDQDADNRLAELHIHYILLSLLEAPNFHDFSQRKDPVFDPPPPVRQLPTGPEHRTEYFMLKTEPIDETSYAGTEQCIEAFMKQMGLNTPEAQELYAKLRALPWGGDGLTTARMRALQRFRIDAENGWDRLDWLIQFGCLFHQTWLVAIDIHQNHYGTSVGHGL